MESNTLWKNNAVYLFRNQRTILPKGNHATQTTEKKMQPCPPDSVGVVRFWIQIVQNMGRDKARMEGYSHRKQQLEKRYPHLPLPCNCVPLPPPSSHDSQNLWVNTQRNPHRPKRFNKTNWSVFFRSVGSPSTHHTSVAFANIENCSIFL